jgi:outer membrane biosynthesis protein TonB
MPIIKVLVFIWPFIKEMVLGDKSVGEAAKDNKMKVLIAFIMIASIGLNMFTINRLWAISQNYLDLRKEYATLAEQSHKPPKVEKPAPAQPTVPVAQNDPKFEDPPPPPPKKGKKSSKDKKEPQPPPTTDSETADRYKKLREDFEKIKKREEKDGT